MKRFLSLIAAVMLLIGLLAGCSKNDAAPGAIGNAADSVLSENSGVSQKDPESGAGLTTTTDSSTTVAPSQKLVRKVWLTAETDDLDALLQQVDQQIVTLSGYAQSREVYHGNANAVRRYRRATMTVRIPVAQLDQFVSHVQDLSNVTSSNETADDITLTYVATESRVKALQTEHDRLLELLVKAETMKDLLEIEARLTDVRAELEEVSSRLKLYDNMVDYATVYLELSEVKEYTVVTEPETVWERIGTGFVESLKDLGHFFTELFVFLVVALPYLVLLGAVAVVLILLHRRRKSKRSKASEAQKKDS